MEHSSFYKGEPMATQIDLSALGISSEDLVQRIVDSVSESLINGDENFDIDGFYTKLKDAAQARTDAAVERIMNEQLGPRIDQYIAELKLQKTSEYGEKKGEPMTFLEYINTLASEWLHTIVDIEGKPTTRYSSKSNAQTRIMWMIDKRIAASMQEALAKCVAESLGYLKDGLKTAAAEQLDRIAESIKLGRLS